MNRGARQFYEKDFKKNAIIFAPHQDDEVLGCGGTIIKKGRAGAEISIVFMTDGRHSHKGLISEIELKNLRAKEAIDANKLLGVEEENVYFLNFEDGRLYKNESSAINKIVDILDRVQPEEIFGPWHLDNHPDHRATNKIMLLSCQLYRKRVRVYEYPIYFWLNWPWISMQNYSPKKVLGQLKNSIFSILNFISFSRLSTFIGDILELKKISLDKYTSQMTKLIPDPRWWTLKEVSNGEWLDCFFQDREIFAHRTI